MTSNNSPPMSRRRLMKGMAAVGLAGWPAPKRFACLDTDRIKRLLETPTSSMQAEGFVLHLGKGCRECWQRMRDVVSATPAVEREQWMAASMRYTRTTSSEAPCHIALVRAALGRSAASWCYQRPMIRFLADNPWCDGGAIVRLVLEEARHWAGLSKTGFDVERLYATWNYIDLAGDIDVCLDLIRLKPLARLYLLEELSCFRPDTSPCQV